jgi:hypothetical protein
MTKAVAQHLLLISCVAVLADTPLLAQKSVRAGTIEWHLYGGGTFDLPGASAFAGIVQATNPANSNQQFLNGRKVQPLVGTGLAVSLGKFFWAYGDYSYMFTDRSTANAALLNSTGTETVNRHYWLASGGIQMTFPTIQRVSPYLEFGGAVLHQSYSRTSQYTNIIGTPFSQQTIANNIAAPHLGGGVRVFVRERQGFRFAVDGYYLTTGVEQRVPGVQGTFPFITRRGWGRITAGYFVHFGRR